MLILISSCKFDFFDDNFEWTVSELYVKRIKETSNVIYRYEAWGGRDSHAYGYRILDSTEVFKVEPENDLPFSYLENILDKNTILGVSHICENSCGENYKNAKPIFTPIKVENVKFKNMNIEHKIYQYKGFTERRKILARYQFEEFKETQDSIFFYNLNDVISKNGKHLDNLRLEKKGITIEQNEDKEVVKIIIEDFTIASNNEIISNKKYFLTPKYQINSDLFTDTEVFKRVK